MIRPGRAAVICPSSNTTSPLTTTSDTPSPYCAASRTSRCRRRSTGRRPRCRPSALRGARPGREPEPLRRERRHLPHGVLERDAPSSRARRGRARARTCRSCAGAGTFGRRRPPRRPTPIIVAGMAQDALQILFPDRVEDAAAAALLDDPQRGLGGVLDRRLEPAALRHVAEPLAVQRADPTRTPTARRSSDRRRRARRG